MKKRMKAPNYLKLWSKNQTERQLVLVSEKRNSFCKKAVDNLCLEVDMCETLEDYLFKFCEGMHELISIGIPRDNLLNHQLAFAKILRLGSDIMDNSQKDEDLFYIGVFIDVKIATNWYKKSFYSMIINMLKYIRKKSRRLPQEMKDKIIKLFKVENYPLYALYFGRDGFKRSG